MGKYNGAVITSVGSALIAEAVAQSETLYFTAVKSSTYVIPDGASIEDMASISDIVQSVAPSQASSTGDLVQIRARFTNATVETAYNINTLGLYGKAGANGTETLIAVIKAITPDIMPVRDDEAPSAFIYNIQATLDNSSSITVTVSDAGTPTIEDYNDLNARLDATYGYISEVSNQSKVMGYMMSHNDYFAPFTDSDGLTVLTDNDDSLIVADWKYKEA